MVASSIRIWADRRRRIVNNLFLCLAKTARPNVLTPLTYSHIAPQPSYTWLTNLFGSNPHSFKVETMLFDIYVNEKGG